MAVVAIVAVLSVIGVYGVRKYVSSATTSEAMGIINSARAAEESYKDETFGYLKVSTMASYFPFGTSVPKGTKKSWDGGDPGELALWSQLGVHPTTVVQFGYACDADETPIPGKAALGISQDLNFPSTAAHWFVVRAAADRDGNGILATFVGSSFTDQIYGENETE
jgi:type II secretory pathway pseudopilin PulG